MEVSDTGYNIPLERTNRHNSIYRIRGPKSLTPEVQKSKLNVLNKQIKNNDITQILGSSPLTWKGKREDLEVAEAEKREIVLGITALRKKLDETKEMYNKKEIELNKMRDEIERMKLKEVYISDDNYKTQIKLEQTRNALEMQKIKLEEALLTKKTYEGMKERIQKDIITDRVKSHKLERNLNSQVRALSTESNRGRKVYQFKAQTQNVFSEVIRQLEDEDRKRQENLSLFEKAVISKEVAERARAERIRRTENLQEVVAKEIVKNDEKQYRNLFFVHKFVHIFMKKQMENEMKSHEKVEQAFQRIRATVGITDAHQFVEKFLKREETYSDLLVSIASHEKNVDIAKRKKEELEQKVQIFKERFTLLEKQKFGQLNDTSHFTNVYKEFHEKSEISKLGKLKLDKAYQWAIRILHTLNKAQRIPQNNYNHESIPKNISSIILKTIATISSVLKKVKNENYGEILDEIDKTNINNEVINKDFVIKNYRVREDEILSEGRQSASSSKSPSRIHHTWEDKHENKEDNIDDESELVLEAKRKHIKAIFSKALYLKRLQEKEKEELEKK